MEMAIAAAIAARSGPIWVTALALLMSAWPTATTAIVVGRGE